jgi:soluble lytic murein transglycosylase-like protein
MGWVITVIALIAFLLMTRKASAGVTMSDTKVITLNDIIEYNAKQYSVPTALIKAVIAAESSWEVYAKNPDDPSYGLMGIMPIVAQEYGIVNDWKNVTQAEIDSIYVPQNNIGCGSKLLGKLLAKYPMDQAVQMYNVGEYAYNVRGARNTPYKNKVIDSYHKYLSEETND